MAMCTALVERSAPSQRDLAIDKAKPPASAAKWQGNDQTDLQCRTARHCHHQVQWATCAAWHWGSGPHSEGEKTPMVWTCGTLQWCSQDRFLHTGWWRAWAWEAQDDIETADREGLQRVEALSHQPAWWTYLEIWCEICHACSKPAIWKGGHWCGCCPCICTLIKNLIMIWWYGKNKRFWNVWYLNVKEVICLCIWFICVYSKFWDRQTEANCRFRMQQLFRVYTAFIQQFYTYQKVEKWSSLTLVQLNSDIPCLCKQCRSRSVGFWRSQLIWICTVCHSVCEFISTTWI